MQLARFLNKLFKKDGFILIDAEEKHYIIGSPEKKKPIRVKLLDKKLHYKLLFRPDLYFGEAYSDGGIIIENGSLTDFLNLALMNIGRNELNFFSQLLNKFSGTYRYLTNFNFIKKSKMNVTKLRYEIKDNQLNILLGIGGSGTTKRIPSKIFIKFMDLVSKNYDCKFFLATGKNEEEQIILNEILNSDFKEKCLPLDNLELREIMPIIKNCKISICNDSSFSHLSAALGIQTIVLMSDTPLLYGSYSPRMHPIIPDGESSVTHDTKGKEKINPKKILEKLNNILN